MAYIHDPEDITPQMSSNTTPAPNVVSASSSYSDYLPWRIFNHAGGAGNIIWLTFGVPTPLNPEWIKFDFGVGNLHVINIKYIMVNIGAEAGVGDLNNPRDWLLQGSNNDADWTTLDSQEDITWVIDEVKTFYFASPTGLAYRYCRLLITDYNPAGYPYLAMAEMELFESLEAGPADYLVQYRRVRRPGYVAGKIV